MIFNIKTALIIPGGEDVSEKEACENQLIKEAKAGNVEAFEELVKQCEKRFLTLLTK